MCADELRSDLRVALSLSGGGFRATLFHVGSLQRLNELGLLSRVTTIASVSGGSITNGVLATRWRRLQASNQNGVFADFRSLIAEPLYEFCRQDLRTEVLLWDRVNPIHWADLLQRDYSVTDRLAASYAEHLGLGERLGSLPTEPEFVFLATNMVNGGPWEFRQNKMGDWYTGDTTPGETTVASAAAASSAFPVAFPPLRLNFNPPQSFVGGEGRSNGRQTVESVTLTDGGVYDNLGVEPVRTGYDFVFVSDAGHPLIRDESPSLAAYPRVARSLDIISNQVGAQRKRWLIEAFKSKDIPLDGAYWGLSSKVSNYGLPGAPSYPNDLLPLLENFRTDLDSFSEGEIGALVNHGYSLANAAALRWAGHLIRNRAPAVWPFERSSDPSLVRADLSGSNQRGILSDLWHSVTRRL